MTTNNVDHSTGHDQLRAGTPPSRLAVRRFRSDEEIAAHTMSLLEWIYVTGRPYFDFLFGDADTSRRNLGRWVCRDNSEFSGRLCHLLTLDDTAAGCLIGVPGFQVADRRRADTMELIRSCSSADRSRLFAALSSNRTALAPVASDEFYIRCLSIDKSHRGRGLGRILLTTVLDEARSFGVRRFRIDVTEENTAARKLYESVGFVTKQVGKLSPLEDKVHSMTLYDE